LRNVAVRDFSFDEGRDQAMSDLAAGIVGGVVGGTLGVLGTTVSAYWDHVDLSSGDRIAATNREGSF
jgi:hypothetical protein